jgi:hypothetical protein
MLDGPAGQRCRPPGDTTLEADHDLAVVVTRQGLAQVLAASEGEAARGLSDQVGP